MYPERAYQNKASSQHSKQVDIMMEKEKRRERVSDRGRGIPRQRDRKSVV